MYFEDFDLSRRFAKVSQLIYFPYIEVIHEYQRGAAKSRKLFIIFAKSMIKYFNKWGWFFDTERRKK
jgi:GT2 family glycosyltransferase